jgi:hypothetical protein
LRLHYHKKHIENDILLQAPKTKKFKKFCKAFLILKKIFCLRHLGLIFGQQKKLKHSNMLTFKVLTVEGQIIFIDDLVFGLAVSSQQCVIINQSFIFVIGI